MFQGIDTIDELIADRNTLLAVTTYIEQQLQSNIPFTEKVVYQTVLDKIKDSK